MVSLLFALALAAPMSSTGRYRYSTLTFSLSSLCGSGIYLASRDSIVVRASASMSASLEQVSACMSASLEEQRAALTICKDRRIVKKKFSNF